jgi:hypothetical protein
MDMGPVLDGGTQEVLISISIPPVPKAPFTTTLRTQWVRTLADGSTLTVQNHRIIMRDSAGRIFQERCLLVPAGAQTTVNRLEISDPVQHWKYFCDPDSHTCELRDYFAEAVPLVVTAAENGKAGNVTHEALGKKMISGVETTGTRETISILAGAMGNSGPLTISKEIWYSSQLGLNLQVTRVDLRHGTQTFEVENLTEAEPDPTFFSVPPGFTVVDERRNSRQKRAASPPGEWAFGNCVQRAAPRRRTAEAMRSSGAVSSAAPNRDSLIANLIGAYTDIKPTFHPSSSFPWVRCIPWLPPPGVAALGCLMAKTARFFAPQIKGSALPDGLRNPVNYEL